MFLSANSARNSLDSRGQLTRGFALLGLICLATSFGCYGSEYPNLEPVTGVVTDGGKPMAEVQVRFIPKEGRPSVGYSNADGEFVLQYNRGVEGAMRGFHTVRLEVPVESPKTSNPNAVPKEPKVINWPNQIEVTSGLAPVTFDLQTIKK